jgi:uncharacterized protein
MGTASQETVGHLIDKNSEQVSNAASLIRAPAIGSAIGVQQIIQSDPIRWHILTVVRTLDLPDCWIGGGFVRNAVWDYLHKSDPSPPKGDIDVIWYDVQRMDPAEDRKHEATLRELEPSVFWSVKNQARMHKRNGDAPYTSATDAMKYWPETATAVAVRRSCDGRCEIAAPFGFDDLLSLTLRPTPRFTHVKRHIYEERLHTKQWLASWPSLKAFEA